MLYAPIPKPNPFGIGKENPRDNKLWYDSLVRLADYNAGTIASYDLSKMLSIRISMQLLYKMY